MPALARSLDRTLPTPAFLIAPVIVTSNYVHAAATHDEFPRGVVGQYVRLDVDQTSCGEISPG